MPDLALGDSLGGYRVVSELARGGMAILYLAEQPAMARHVVIKLLSPQLLSDPTFMQRFEREVRTTATLQHPHIIPIYDVGQFEGQPYLVMAYVAGGTLADRMAGGPVPFPEMLHIVRDIASALDLAHGRGIVHRDIKPHNILLDEQGNAVLTDFGIARVLSDSQVITVDKVVGTPAYMAPELIADRGPITPAVDIYALGMTLYHALAGTHPFGDRPTMQMMWAQVNEVLPTLEDSHPELPGGTDAVLQRALAKEPVYRYQKASEMAADLQRIAGGERPIESPTPPPPRPGLSTQFRTLESAVSQVIDSVVKIVRPDGGSGSGILLPEGRVVTCLHVVDGAPGLYIVTRAGGKAEADVVALDADVDLALLTVRNGADGVHAAAVHPPSGEPPNPEPGEMIAAIGHPLGLDWAVAGGHYNGLRQPGDEAIRRFGITLDCPVVHVDVAINPGNSGGPLIDAEGRLIGLADAILNPALVNNVGFAIDASTVWGFVARNKEASTAWQAYNDGHHYPAGLSHSPATGRPIQPAEAVPMALFEGNIVRCSNCHTLYPSQERACPQCGKRNTSGQRTGTSPLSRTRTVVAPVSEELVTCSNCHTEYPASETHCPQCGKPRVRRR